MEAKGLSELSSSPGRGGNPVLVGAVTVLILGSVAVAVFLGVKLKESRADQKRLESIRLGMSEAEVISLLGQPRLQNGPPLKPENRPLGTESTEMPPCVATEVVRESIYYRAMRQSLHVYYNARGQVVCTRWSHMAFFDPVEI